MLQPSKTSEPIPGYIVRQRIGVGGYGEVWSAQAPGGLSKAIKFVYGYFDDARAARELKALDRIKQVRHPFLLSLERFEVVDGQLLIVTELADMSLKDRCEQLKAGGQVGIPRDELLGYLRDAADALDYMSATFSLQHLDVKPENLLLVGGRVKVADFGLVKDLHEVSASLMGGLTPIYAPPEAFDDRPSQHSDQYSLAIVYQEMLTGVLPFPGKTPAQLASQHLHARPRLAPLPVADQDMIARALSKDPQQRYPNCRALIDSLLAPEQATRSSQKPDERPETPGGYSISDTVSVRSHTAKTDTAPQRSAGPIRRPAPLPPPDLKTQILGGDTARGWTHVGPVPADMPPAATVVPVVDLGPLELASTDNDLRPTLFLGIGGTAGRTLRRLRRRLRDRLGHDASVPALQMLLLDTDAKSVYQATQGAPEAALADSEIMSLPLRNAHDYTNDSRNILQWLSRRWLYNIPRSLQTEGRRPLGRLALVDHAPQVLDRVRKALREITSPEAVSATAEASGLTVRGQSPRVYLIASISGGTGGGIVLDLAFAVRKILTDLGFSEDGVCLVLTHSTDRNPAASDLAIANAYACLSELQHYVGCGYYPGEPAGGIPPWATDGVFSSTYFLHLGDDLNDQEFDAATDTLATYLYLDSLTPAGAVFDQCRKLAPAEGPGATLRSVGLACVGGTHTAIPELATELLGRQVIDRWRGGGNQARPTQRLASLAGSAAQPSGEHRPLNQSVVEEQAAGFSKQLELDVDSLRGQVSAILEDKLGGDAEAIFARIKEKDDASSARSAGKGSHRVAHMLHAAQGLFGPPIPDEDAKKPSNVPLRVALEQDLEQLGAAKGTAVRDWILELVEHADTRVGGALKAKNWFANHLSALETQRADMWQEARRNLQALEHAVLSTEEAPAPRTRAFGGRRAEKPTAEVDAAILFVIRLRIQEIALHGMHKLLRLISARISSAGDCIKDLQRDLGILAQNFVDDAPLEGAASESAEPSLFDEVRTTIAESFRQRIPELAARVDERFQAQLLEQGGLRQTCQKDGTRSQLATDLRALARAEVVRTLREIPLTEIVFGSDQTTESRLGRLQTCLDLAKPQWTDCGGSRRLLAILPENSADSALQQMISRELEPAGIIVKATGADLVFCYEMQDLSLPSIAARLADGRSDFARIAARLHTRVDVTWTELTAAAATCAASAP